MSSLVCGFLSILILLTELTTFVFRLKGTQLSIIGIPIHYLKSSSMLRTFSAAVSLSYIFLCFFRSFFLLRIPFVECYHLYFHHTDVYALAENAINLCRFQFSLFYHYFTLFQVGLERTAHVASG